MNRRDDDVLAAADRWLDAIEAIDGIDVMERERLVEAARHTGQAMRDLLGAIHERRAHRAAFVEQQQELTL
jgi:4-aminobutyrate aminotransferase-like enzyme